MACLRSVTICHFLWLWDKDTVVEDQSDWQLTGRQGQVSLLLLLSQHVCVEVALRGKQVCAKEAGAWAKYGAQWPHAKAPGHCPAGPMGHVAIHSWRG